MKRAFIILAAALAAFPWRPAFADRPEGIAVAFAVDKFYRTCMKFDLRGLPTPDQMKRFAPLFTSDLNGMIEDARRHREKLLRDTPTSGQPWREGNLFASMRKGISFYGIGFPAVQGDIATVPMHLEYHERGQITRWVDVIVLARSGRHWLVDDIFLNAPWPLMSGASLRSRLWLPMNEVASRREEVPAVPKEVVPVPVPVPSIEAKPAEAKKAVPKPMPPVKVIPPKVLQTI